MKELLNWINKNQLDCEILKNILAIDSLGRFLFVRGIEDIIIDKDFSMILTEEEISLLESDDSIKFLVFKFGNRFYYCDVNNKKKNEYNEEVIIPQFNDFINLGLKKSSFEEFNFCNLGVHSGYELLNGSGDTSSWVKKCKYLGQRSIGVCEKNSLASSLSIQLDCEKNKIKSIIGMTVCVAYNYKEEAEHQEIYEFKLFVKEKKGWQNLLRISKSINVDYCGFIPLEELLGKLDGLILVVFRESYLFLNMRNPKLFKLELNKLKNNIASEDLYLQIDLNEFEDSDLDIKNLNDIKFYFDNLVDKIKPVYIEDCYYVEEIDSNVKAILNKIDRKNNPSSNQQYFKSIDQIIEKNINLFQSDDSINSFFNSIKNTSEISDKCNFKIDIGASKIPEYRIDNKKQFFEDLLAKGFLNKIAKNYDNESELEVYLERLEIEKKVILDADLVDYFLVLWDIIRWSVKNDILVGPGRGSAAGSLICYLLNITEVDPIKYNLLFERFLNEVRVMPDTFFEITLENEKIIKIKKGSQISTIDGEIIIVENSEQLQGLEINITNL